MDKQQAQQLINEIFTQSFDLERYQYFLRNLLNDIEKGSRGGKQYTGNYIPDAYKQHVNQYWCLGKYVDPEGGELDLLAVEIKSLAKLDRARSALRNFAVNRLKQFDKEASLIAFYAKDDGGEDWRFSFVKIEHEAYQDDKGKVKLKQELTPARRYSYLVGTHENSHTAAKQLLPILVMDYANPRIEEIEAAFSIEKVTDEFFEQYKALFQKLAEHLKQQRHFKCANEEETDQAVSRFAKKLIGQIVFLYFLQKKGWLGVHREGRWGEGSRRFMRERFEQVSSEGGDYHHDFLQYLFYEALACERAQQSDSGYYERFDCRVPFLNGGLFEADYDWQKDSLDLPNHLFHNDKKNRAGDEGTGILDVFDRYNFTIKEDEPLDKEVAVDPEMLGKVFENMLEVTERKSKGAFYTPREIVHYMCQESLIHYLDNAVNHRASEADEGVDGLFSEENQTQTRVPKEDLSILIRKGHLALENDQRVLSKGKETDTYKFQLPESVRSHAKTIDKVLTTIKVCDPAIGSGAFPVGLLHEIVNTRLALAPHSGNQQSPYDLKRHAIGESIYGVDIDASAIDIARLRLWLSLIVDEEDYGSIEALPNLDYKIMQGNSLVEEYWGVKLFNEAFIEEDDLTEEIQELQGLRSRLGSELMDLHNNSQLTPDKKLELEKQIRKINKSIKALQEPNDKDLHLELFDNRSEAKKKAAQLEHLHNDFFSASSAEKKQQIRQKITQLEWDLIEATLKERHQLDSLKKLEQIKQSKEKPFFLWKLNFSEVFKQHGGFDLVIGNPPYGVSIKGESRSGMVNTFGKVPDFEIYYFFIERARGLLAEKGVCSYIIPNSILFNVYAANYRKKITEEWKILEILDCTKFPLFESAVVRNIVFSFGKNEPDGKMHYRSTAKPDSFVALISQERESMQIANLMAFNQNWGLAFRLSKIIIKAITTIRDCSTPLAELNPDISQGLIAYDKYRGQSKEVIESRAYHFDKYKPGLKKWLKGEDITRYKAGWNGRHYIDYCDGIANPRDPKYFHGERVLIREITNPSIFAASTTEELYNDPSILIVKTDPGRVRALELELILNSEIATFYHFNFSPKATKGAFPKILISDVKKFPIKNEFKKFEGALVLVAKYIRFLKPLENFTLHCSFFDQLGGGLIYELYLPDEIRAAGKEVLTYLGDLLAITEVMSDKEKLAIIQREFDRLYDPAHPVRNHLGTLDSVEVVHTIREALKK
ncbi:MAG: hypothetical protein NPIRA05_10110 [Nitrospirales bacterium]|nr:MAG: hypothetical protein NPIRA05_10110 [Nitrospirales bacterium]